MKLGHIYCLYRSSGRITIEVYDINYLLGWYLCYIMKFDSLATNIIATSCFVL